MNETRPSKDPLGPLRDPATIRLRCAAVTRAVEENRSSHFKLDRSRLPETARRVTELTRRNYPDLKIPYHSRWRHFEAGGLDRKAEMDALLAGSGVTDPADVARARFDLTVVSVLLDAGAGAQWTYSEQPGRRIDALALPVQRQKGDDLLAMLNQATGAALPVPDATEAPPSAAADKRVFGRSEGLGVASFRGFVGGVFSASAHDPLRADAQALKRLDAAALRALFQASPSNPMVGLEGRAALLSRLGDVLQDLAARDGGEARPGRLYDSVTVGGTRAQVAAAEVLRTVLVAFAPIWRSGSQVQGLLAGDVWRHAWAGAEAGSGAGDATTSGWVPFHKLSQWLTYSLLEPLEWAGVRVTGLDALTGLPEYRNGGLLIDSGVIVPRDPRDLEKIWKPGDDFIVEWRALTVTLLDELAVLVRLQLGVTAEQMPLACILEGGTWAAGRQIAKELRDGAPPVQIESDGTVF
ncbi:MAG TPA: URC4/urg3 family protein [Rubrivivax sp.]